MLDAETNFRAEIDRQADGPEEASVGRRFANEATEKILHQLRFLAQLQTPKKDMAALLGISLSAFQAFLDRSPEAVEEIERGRAEGNVTLRRAQFRLAAKNAGMALFLAKNLLLRSDKIEARNAGAIQIVIDEDDGAEIEKNAGGRRRARVRSRFANEATDEILRQLRYLARLHCPHDEMAGILRIPLSTFQAFLKRSPEAVEEIERGLAEGKLNLLRALFRHAKRNRTVAKFLEKHHLFPSDKTGRSNAGAIKIVID